MESNELFSKAEFYKNVGQKSSKKRPGSPVIDMAGQKWTLWKTLHVGDAVSVIRI